MGESPQPFGVLGGHDAYRDYLDPDEPEVLEADEDGQLHLWPSDDNNLVKRMAA